MKIAISISEDIYRKAETVAARLGTSRSAAFARAMDAFEPDLCDGDLTDQINRIVDSMTDEERAEQQAWLSAGAATVLRHTAW